MNSPQDPFIAKRRITLFLAIPAVGALVFFLLIMLAQPNRWSGESTTSALAKSALWFLFGWLTYPLRVFPQLPFNTMAILVFLATLVLFTVGCHWLFKWLAPSTEKHPAPWRFKWTFLITTALTLTLIFSMSLGMVFHQVGWLITRKKNYINPAFRHPLAPQSALDYSAYYASHLQASRLPDHYRRLYEPNAFTLDSRSLDHLAHIEAAYVLTPTGDVYAYVSRPRDPDLRLRHGITISTATETKSLPANAWPAIFEALQTQANAQPPATQPSTAQEARP